MQDREGVHLDGGVEKRGSNEAAIRADAHTQDIVCHLERAHMARSQPARPPLRALLPWRPWAPRQYLPLPELDAVVSAAAHKAAAIREWHDRPHLHACMCIRCSAETCRSAGVAPGDACKSHPEDAHGQRLPQTWTFHYSSCQHSGLHHVRAEASDKPALPPTGQRSPQSLALMLAGISASAPAVDRCQSA